MTRDFAQQQIPATARRVAYHRFGDPGVLQLEQEPVQIPGPGQVLIRSETLGVNPIDWKMVAGYFGDTERLPGVPGWTATGTVVAVGDGVRSPAVGQKVIAGPRGGGFREFLRGGRVFPGGTRRSGR